MLEVAQVAVYTTHKYSIGRSYNFLLNLMHRVTRRLKSRRNPYHARIGTANVLRTVTKILLFESTHNEIIFGPSLSHRSKDPLYLSELGLKCDKSMYRF
jgi:hypothetical protein